jgi:disulfide oxidoreductase YuzD
MSKKRLFWSVVLAALCAAPAAAGVRITEEFKGGKLSDLWEPLAAAGGSFKRFARLDPGKLTVSVPAGRSWGKTGIMSREPLFTVEESMSKTPLTIDFAFGNDASTGYCIALSSSKDADVWRQPNVWLRWSRKSDEEGVFHFSNTQDDDEDYGAAETSGKADRMVTLSVSPGTVKVDTSQGKHLTGSFSWLKAGTPVYLYVFSHPLHAGGPAGLVLHSIRVR